MALESDGESALAVLVGEAEECVGRLRRHYDPSAQEDMPAHITILWPFKPPETITDTDIRNLTRLFTGHEPFPYVLDHVAAFEGSAVYLAPDPAEPFVELAKSVTAAFPEYPPYRGLYPKIIPHLTVAQTSRDSFAAVQAECATALSGELPLHAETRSVTLFVRQAGPWRSARSFPLGRM